MTHSVMSQTASCLVCPQPAIQLAVALQASVAQELLLSSSFLPALCYPSQQPAMQLPSYHQQTISDSDRTHPHHQWTPSAPHS